MNKDDAMNEGDAGGSVLQFVWMRFHCICKGRIDVMNKDDAMNKDNHE